MFRLALLIVCSYSLFEDQIGTYDWQRIHLGKISEIWRVSRGRSLAYSERGLISLIKPSGEIEWRRVVSSLDSKVKLIASSTEIYTFSNGALTAWTVDEGQIVWTRAFSDCNQLTLSKLGVNEVLLAIQDNNIEVISLIDGETIKKIEVKNIQQVISKNNESLVLLAKGLNIWKINIKTSATEIIESNYEGDVLCAKDICIAIHNNLAAVYQNNEIKQIDWKFGKISHTISNFFVLSDNSLIEIVDFQPILKQNLSVHIPSVNSAMWLTQSSSEIKIERLDFQPITLEDSSNLSPVIKFWSHSNDKGDVLGYLLLEDYRILCFSSASIKWVREEGLGQLKSVYFMELPSKEMHAHNQYFSYVKEHNSWNDVVNNFMLRIQSQIYKPNLEVDILEKDNFAFKKLILGVSESGYIIALQSLTSQIIWRLKVNDIKSIIQINPEEALIISTSSTSTHLNYLDIISGHIIVTKVFEFETAEVLKTGDEENTSIYLIDKAFKVHEIHNHYHNNLYFYIVNTATNSIEGYHYKNSTTKKIWASQISKSESITSYITNHSGKIHQPAIATGTSRLIYKYADENLFAISTQKGTDLYIYIINSISGHIIYRIHQEGVLGIIHMAFHEHKLFVHYWNSKFERFEILSVELFKSNVDDSAGDVLKNYYSGKFYTEYSSQFTPELTIFSQTFEFPYGVKDMKMTTTLQGITKPSLVLILDSNQIYLLGTEKDNFYCMDLVFTAMQYI